MILKLKDGDVEIELYKDIAPNHVKRFETFANEGKYDGVVFHRVIDGFMAQTGDIKFGNSNSPDYNLNLAGTGGSELPNLKAEFSDLAHNKGVLSMARSSDPNSANSQFFIVFEFQKMQVPAPLKQQLLQLQQLPLPPQPLRPPLVIILFLFSNCVIIRFTVEIVKLHIKM